MSVTYLLFAALTHKMPIANWDTTRQIIEYKKPYDSALIFCFAKCAPSTAKCMLRMVVAVAYDDGKISCKSLAAWMTKKLLTVPVNSLALGLNVDYL